MSSHEPLQLDKYIPVLHAYSHYMTSYLEAVGAVFESYNRHCQYFVNLSFHQCLADV